MTMKPGNALREKTTEQLDELLAAADRAADRLEVRADVGDGPDATQKVNAVMRQRSDPPEKVRSLTRVLETLPPWSRPVIVLALIGAVVFLALRGVRVIP